MTPRILFSGENEQKFIGIFKHTWCFIGGHQGISNCFSPAFTSSSHFLSFFFFFFFLFFFFFFFLPQRTSGSTSTNDRTNNNNQTIKSSRFLHPLRLRILVQGRESISCAGDGGKFIQGLFEDEFRKPLAFGLVDDGSLTRKRIRIRGVRGGESISHALNR